MAKKTSSSSKTKKPIKKSETTKKKDVESRKPDEKKARKFTRLKLKEETVGRIRFSYLFCLNREVPEIRDRIQAIASTFCSAFPWFLTLSPVKRRKLMYQDIFGVRVHRSQESTVDRLEEGFRVEFESFLRKYTLEDDWLASQMFNLVKRVAGGDKLRSLADGFTQSLMIPGPPPPNPFLEISKRWPVLQMEEWHPDTDFDRWRKDKVGEIESVLKQLLREIKSKEFRKELESYRDLVCEEFETAQAAKATRPVGRNEIDWMLWLVRFNALGLRKAGIKERIENERNENATEQDDDFSEIEFSWISKRFDGLHKLGLPLRARKSDSK